MSRMYYPRAPLTIGATLIPASARQVTCSASNPRGLMFRPEIKIWFQRASASQSYYEDMLTTPELQIFNDSYQVSIRDNWITREGTALHSGEVWIHMKSDKPGGWIPIAAFDMNPDSPSDSAKITMWLVAEFQQLHGTEIPFIILRKDDYNIYDLLHKAVFGDTTKVFDSILPVVDHWHPVKGAFEALCGLKTAASPVSSSALLYFRDEFQLMYVSRVVCAHDLLTSTSPAGLPKVLCDYDGNLLPPPPLLRSTLLVRSSLPCSSCS